MTWLAAHPWTLAALLGAVTVVVTFAYTGRHR